MKIKYLLAASVVTLAASTTVATPVFAQQITTNIQGTVVGEDGNPIVGATVVVTDTRTNSSRTLSTGPTGSFNAPNLTSGGPYTVTVTAPGFEGQSLPDIFTSVQGSTNLQFTLSSGAGEIVVTGARVQTTQLAVGPGTSFGVEVLENAPTFDRDIRDIIRIDPRVSLDRDDAGGGADRISCLGGSDRSNSFTVDAIGQGDLFGLNDTPFASRSSAPIPYDAIRETQVAFAPFDVDYGNFTGCSINVITKSGTNDIRFGGFFEYSDNGLRGSKVDGESVAPVEPQKRWGGYLSGPIIKDRLFIFAAYEHQEASFSQDVGPAGAGFPASTEISQVTLEQFQEISEVLSSVYGIETGPIVTSRPFENDRYFVRGDLQITDNHRFEATYQRLEESSTFSDDMANSGSFDGAVVGRNTFYLSGTESNYYSGRLYSQWSDNFSTEIRYARAEIQDIQDPVGGGEAQLGNPIPRIIVGIDNGSDPAGAVQAGPGFSRAANDLRTNLDLYRVAGEIEAGNHRFKIGAEWNHASIYNLFVQNATGQLVFQNIDDLREGILSNGTSTFATPANVVAGDVVGAYGRFSASGDINDAAAQFNRDIYSIFAQDEWQATDALTLTAGVRVDWFDGGRPNRNPNFVARYGFGNDVGFSALDPVVLPRFAFDYELDDFAVFSRPSLRGGVGIFSGGDPLVWFSNAWSNDGVGSAEGDTTDAPCPAGPIDVVVNGQFTGLPTCFQAAASAAAAAGQGDTQSIDPNIQQPTVLRANIGFSAGLNFAESGFFSNWNLNLDYIYSKYRNPLGVVDLIQAPDLTKGLSGFTVDGRPIYSALDPSNPFCTASLAGTGGAPPVWQGLSSACFRLENSAGGAILDSRGREIRPGRDDEIQLTNTGGYESHIASILLSKTFDGGVFTDAGSVDFSFGYAYTDAQDRRNLYNSTATSNLDRSAFFDLQNPEASRGFYGSRHNLTSRLSFREEFFDDLDTRLGLTFVARSGRPYSLTFSGGGVLADSSSGNDNQLLYIPTGVNDPNIVGSSSNPATAQAQVQALVDFLGTIDCDNGYEGRTIARNTCSNDWYFDLDLSISQEIPGPGRFFGRNDKFRLFATVDNFLNLLDNSWNVQRRRNFVGLQDIVSLSRIDSQGRYVIGGSTDPDVLRANFDGDNQINFSSSVYRIKVGVSYDF